MINLLKEQITFKIGRNILDRGDCEYLSQHIEIETGECLNYNTLRRFFEIDKQKFKPRISTLNILSQYIGYQSFYHFSSFKPQKIYFEQHLKMYDALNTFHAKFLNEYLNDLSSNYNQRLSFIIQVCRFGLLSKQIDELCKLLDMMEHHIQSFSYDEMIVIGNSVGLLFRKLTLNKSDWKKLYNNVFFNQYVFEIFVDYSSLNTFYFGFINHKPKSKDQHIFKNALKVLRDYLNYSEYDNKIKILQDKSTINSLHPILQGRLLSVHLYNGSATEEIIKSIENKSLEHFYEPMVASILSLNFVWFDYIKKNILDFINETSFRSIHYFQVYSLLNAIYAYKTNQFKLAAQHLKEINPNKFRLSYLEILEFFYCLVDYKINMNEESKERVLFLSSTFNYPRYNIDFIERF